MPISIESASHALLDRPVSGESRTAITSPGSPYVRTAPKDEKEAEDRVVKMVLERQCVAERFDRPFKERNLLHWMQVNNILPPNFPFNSRYFEGETANVSYRTIEAVMAPIYQKDTLCRVKALDDQGDVERDMMQLVMDAVLRDHVKYKNSLYYQFQETAFFGNGVVRHFIENKEVVKFRQQPVFAGEEYRIQIGTERVEEKKFESWPNRRVLSRFDCYPAPTGATIQEMPYFIERLVLPLETIRFMGQQSGYRHTDEMQGFFILDRTEGYALGEWSERHFDLMERLSAVGFDVEEGSVIGTDCLKYGELLMYSEAPASGHGCKRIIIVGDRKHLCWDSDWPRPDAPQGGNPHRHGLKPYSETKFARPRIGQVWQCKGVPEMLEDQQLLLNSLTNSGMDMIAEERMPMTLVEDGAGVQDLSELVRQPGKIVRVGRAEGVVDRIAPQVPTDIWQNAVRVRDNINRYGSTPGLQAGSVTGKDRLSGGADTLGGMNIITSEADQSKVFNLLFGEQGVEDGLNIMASDVQQVLTTPQRFQIVGHSKSLKMAGFGKSVVVNPEQIQGQWHCIVLGPSRAMSSEKKAALLASFLEYAGRLPEVKDRIKQLEDLIEFGELFGIDDPMRLFKSDEEFEQWKQQMAGVPHPTPPVLSDFIKRFKDLEPDVQAQVVQAAGFIPSRVGGSSPIDKMVGEHLSKEVFQNKEHANKNLMQATKQPRYLPQRQSNV